MEARMKFCSVARGFAYEFYATPEAVCRAGFSLRVRSRTASASSPSSSSEPTHLSRSDSPHANEESPVPDIKNLADLHGCLPAVPSKESLGLHEGNSGVPFGSFATASPAASPRASKRRSRALGAIASSLRSICELNLKRPAPASSGSSPPSAPSSGASSQGSHKQRRLKAYKLAHPEKFPRAFSSPSQPKKKSRESSSSSKSDNKSRGPSFVPPSSQPRVGKSNLSVGSLASQVASPPLPEPQKHLVSSLPASLTAGLTLCPKCGKSCYVRPQYLDGNGDCTVVRKNTPACPCFDAEVKDAKRQAKKNALELSGARESISDSKCSTHPGSISCSPGSGSPSCVFRSIDLVPEPVSSRKIVKPKKEKKVREKKESEEITSATWNAFCSYHENQWKCSAHRSKVRLHGKELKCKPPWRVRS